MKNLYLTNATIVIEKSILHDGYIHIKEGIIETVGEMADCPSFKEEDRVFDCRGKQYVIPGMIDIHVHGAAGCDFMDSNQEAYEEIALALAKEGTTSFLATTMTNPVQQISKALINLTKYMQNSNGAGVAEMVGIHLEGPFINKEQKGAQPEKEILPPDVTMFKEWQELAREMIKIITFAPELDNKFELVTVLKEMGVVPSMGHTNASYDSAISAIDHGVSHATHLFNGMKGLHHRDPGVVGAALISEEVFVEIIPDGIHFHPDLLKLIVRMKGLERIMVITDGIRAKGMPDGDYDLGGQLVSVLDGKCTLSSNGSLAGSIVTMNDARLNIEKWLGLSIYDQIQITSKNQAKRLGLYNRKGSIEAGKDADIVVIGRNGQPELTICRGVVAYELSGAFN